MRHVFVGASVALLALFAACGGKVVFEGGDGGAGGVNGTGTLSTSVNSTTTTSGPVTTVSTGPDACGTPAPVGPLDFCGGSSAAGPGNLACLAAVCDQGGNRWEQDCSGQSCTCLFNSVEICVCVVAEDACTGQGCCPPPFPDP